jgi:hypothetical protein
VGGRKALAKGLNDPWKDPAYRLAMAGSTAHRDDELAFQWHVYRLRNVKGGVDAGPPHAMQMHGGPGGKKPVGSANLYRQQEIRAANTALVSRIRTQRSAYADLFDPEMEAAREKMKQRKLRHMQQQHALRPDSSPTRGGVVGALTSRVQARNIELGNQTLLRQLKRIDSTKGPYNAEAAHASALEMASRVRRRPPALMHAHPTALLKDDKGKWLPPPIHWSVIAARATSPSKAAPPINHSHFSRRPATAAQRAAEPAGTDWRAYAASKGLLASSASTPALHVQPSSRTGGHSSSTSRPQPSPYGQQHHEQHQYPPQPTTSAGAGFATGRSPAAAGRSTSAERVTPSTGRASSSPYAPSVSAYSRSSGYGGSPSRPRSTSRGPATSRPGAAPSPTMYPSAFTARPGTSGYPGYRARSDRSLTYGGAAEEKSNDAHPSPFSPSSSSASARRPSSRKALSAAQQRQQQQQLQQRQKQQDERDPDSLLAVVADMDVRGERKATADLEDADEYGDDPDHESSSLADVAAGGLASSFRRAPSPHPDEGVPSLLPLHPVPLATKRRAGCSTVPLRVEGMPCVVAAEVAAEQEEGAPPSVLQFSCYRDMNGAADDAAAADGDELPLPLLVSYESLAAIFPSSIDGLVFAPFTDLTSLLYALAPRFYFRERTHSHPTSSGDSFASAVVFAMHMDPAFDAPVQQQLLHQSSSNTGSPRKKTLSASSSSARASFGAPTAASSGSPSAAGSPLSTKRSLRASGGGVSYSATANNNDAADSSAAASLQPSSAAAEAAAASNAEPAPAATYLADELLDNAGADVDDY